MRTTFLILAIYAAITSVARSQATDTETDKADSIREKLFQQAKDYQFQSRTKANGPVDLTLRERSLLNWTNPIRSADTGIIVIWDDEGLPLAFGTLYTRGSRYTHSLTSLSELPLKATYQGQKTWTPAPGVKWRPWQPDETTVAKSKALRKAQMRNIARQFEFQLKSGQNSSPLRLMPEPLYRFSSSKHGVLDGAVMAFAEGNDAESLLILRADESDRTWKYACARSGYFEMTGSVEGQKIWHVNHVNSTNATTGARSHRDSPYISGTAPIAEAQFAYFDDQSPRPTDDK